MASVCLKSDNYNIFFYIPSCKRRWCNRITFKQENFLAILRSFVLPGMLFKMYSFYADKIVINNTFITIVNNNLDITTLSLV